MAGNVFWSITAEVLRFHTGWRAQLREIRSTFRKPNAIIPNVHMVTLHWDFDSKDDADVLYKEMTRFFEERGVRTYEGEDAYGALLNEFAAKDIMPGYGRWPVEFYLSEHSEDDGE